MLKEETRRRNTLRDIPVYEGWLEGGTSVYKASSQDEFLLAVTEILAKQRPDLSAGRKAAEDRSLKAVAQPEGGRAA